MLWQASRLAKAAGALCALVVFPVWAHYDGDVGNKRHIYRVNSAQTNYWYTPQEAGQDACGKYGLPASFPLYHSVEFTPAKQWKVNCTNAINQINSVTFTSDTNEKHCDYGKERVVNNHPDPCSSAGVACYPFKDQQRNWYSKDSPYGFNVPDDSSLPPEWAEIRGCSLIRLSAVPFGECTSISYKITGSGAIDEDGLWNAAAQGNFYSNQIPGVCDPATGNTTPIGQDPVADPANVCAQRSGSSAGGFAWEVPYPVPTPIPQPLYVCSSGCKAVQDGANGVCAAFGENPTEATCTGDYKYPFPDEANFGRCSASDNCGGDCSAMRQDTPPGDGGGGGDSGPTVPGDANNDGTCDPDQGELCGEYDTTGMEAGGDGYLTGMESEAVTLGQDAASTAAATSPAFGSSVNSWAGGAGTAVCQPWVVGGRFQIPIDPCDFFSLLQTILAWCFWILTGFHLFGVYIRAQAT